MFLLIKRGPVSLGITASFYSAAPGLGAGASAFFKKSPWTGLGQNAGQIHLCIFLHKKVLSYKDERKEGVKIWIPRVFRLGGEKKDSILRPVVEVVSHHQRRRML